MGRGSESCWIKMQSSLESLTRGESRVAMHILAHPRRTVGLSISEVSAECGVSEATIVRFCKSLGYDGYRDFRIALAQELGVIVPEVNREPSFPDGDVPHLAKQIFENSMKAIQTTLENLDYRAIEAAIDALAHARVVQFCGAGSSNVVALDAHIRFLRIGLAGAFSSNAHLQAMSASLLTPEDVAVGISYSGSTRDTVDALGLAREAGATTIGITNFRDMPICEVADIILYTKADEAFFQGGTMASRSAELAILDLLFVGTVLKRGEAAKEGFARTKRALFAKLRLRHNDPISGCNKAPR